MASNYIQQIETWRTEMEAQLHAPGPWGWLAVVGTYPLQAGKNTIGSSRKCTVRLPEGAAPERLGVLEFDGRRGKLRVTAKEPVLVDGEEIRLAFLRNHRETGGMSVVQVRNISFGIMESVNGVYEVCVWDADSPKRQTFPARAWYPVNPAWRLTGRFIPNPSAAALIARSVNGYTPELMHVGNVFFLYGGYNHRFAAMRSVLGPKYVWLHVRDWTNRKIKTTYQHGRFLQALLLEDEGVDVDFNRLVLPPAAFCEYITCPMPPISNFLRHAVEAGERFPE